MIKLKKQADRKVRHGGLWIFSNEIADPPVKDLIPGQIYDLIDFSGQFLGVVYANPKSLITARVLSRRKIEIDSNFIRMRIENAFQSRQPFCRDREAYRIFFGEADLLPGLVVDRYGPNIVVQSSTAGVDLLLDKIVEAIDDLFSPESIIFRNDSSIRNLEGVPIYKEIKRGSNVDRIEFRSRKLSFVADLINGQKTGFFLDQEFNRTVLKRHIPSNANVLDLYCYSGAWGMNAIEAGADTVTAVDSSSAALELAFGSACLNNFESKINLVREDVGQFLGHCSDQFDVVVLDPPAFIKSRSKVREGRQGYIDVNRKALGKLKPGGLFVTCSCSGHMGLTDFLEAINVAAYRNGRDLRILEVLGQGPDHPTLMAMPETRYLKVIMAQAL